LTVIRIPPSNSEDELALYAPLGCGMQTGAGAIVNTLRVRPGSSVAVFGAGSRLVGMATVMATDKIAGAGTVIAVDLRAEGLVLAKKLGATPTVLVPDGTAVVERIREVCLPNGVDFSVDCTGVPRVIQDVIDCLGTRGRAASVGTPGFGKTVSFDGIDHISYGKEYVGCCEGDSLPQGESTWVVQG
jgi:Zn-dependent alcohol dehydrogenase